MIDRDGKGEVIASDNFIINDIPFHISLLLEKYKKKEEGLDVISVEIIESN